MIYDDTAVTMMSTGCVRLLAWYGTLSTVKSATDGLRHTVSEKTCRVSWSLTREYCGDIRWDWSVLQQMPWWGQFEREYQRIVERRKR